MNVRMPILKSSSGAARSRTGFVLALIITASLLVAACSSSGGGRGTFITADDGLVLRGRSYGSGATGVILAHELGGNQGNWDDFATRLAGRGFFVLTFDFRGHGDSSGPREAGIADSDLAAAARLLASADGFARTNFFIVGASMGGTAALKVAVRERALGVVTLSSPINVQGLSVRGDIPNIDGPKLFIVAQNDQPFADDANAMFADATDPKNLQVLEGSAHGTDLLRGDTASETRRLIFDFLDSNR